jgi:hypothetical protein
MLTGQPLRPDQQAEQHEHHDLRQPGRGVENTSPPNYARGSAGCRP